MCRPEQTCNLCWDVFCVKRGKGRTIVEVEPPFTDKGGIPAKTSIDDCLWRKDKLSERGVDRETPDGWETKSK